MINRQFDQFVGTQTWEYDPIDGVLDYIQSLARTLYNPFVLFSNKIGARIH
jgi:hypothetical protein